MSWFFAILVASAAAQPSSDILNVFVVPHTHLDVGWVWPIDAVYEGYVRDIYTSVAIALNNNVNRKFICVEQYFFERWWNDESVSIQQPQVKQQIANAIQEGRFEFVIGGWVMNDEAVSHYQANIDQMTLGHQFIYNTFGVVPKYGWQIDPFGASTTTAIFESLMGFNGHVIARIGAGLTSSYQQDQDLEFVWRPSASLPNQRSEIFTHVMDQFQYCSPGLNITQGSYDGMFYWDGYAVIPKPPNNEYQHKSVPVTNQTLVEYIEFFAANVKQRASYYLTNNVLWPWGCDKQHFNATWEFENMDLLINAINADSSLGLNVQYATLDDFFTALHKSDQVWPVRGAQDFFPYWPQDHQYWTGFYTSRPQFKGLVRLAQARLRSVEMLNTFAQIYAASNNQPINDNLSQLSIMRGYVAMVQHHDAVSGTMAPVVLAEYITYLTRGFKILDAVALESMSALLIPSDFPYQLTLNASQGSTAVNLLDLTVYDPMMDQISLFVNTTRPVILFNSLSHVVSQYVRVNVDLPFYSVVGENGNPVASSIFSSVTLDAITYDLFFFAVMQPMSVHTYFVVHTPTPGASTPSSSSSSSSPPTSSSSSDSLSSSSSTSTPSSSSSSPPPPSSAVGRDSNVAENDVYTLTYDPTTHLLVSVANKLLSPGSLGSAERPLPMGQNFYFYNSWESSAPTSDDYTFRPMGLATPLPPPTFFEIMETETVTQIVQTWPSSPSSPAPFTQITRLYQPPAGVSSPRSLLSSYIEMQFMLGPLAPNTEIITRLDTNLALQTNQTFYTDDNGVETIKRTFNNNLGDDSIAGNYYPMVTSAFMIDEEKDLQLTLLSERSHGVSSQVTGQMEVMLHRRVLNNGGAYNLSLDDTTSIQPTLWMILGDRVNSSHIRRQLSLELNNPAAVFFGPTLGYDPANPNINVEDGRQWTNWTANFTTSFTPLLEASNVPDKAFVLTVQQQFADNLQFVLRLQHLGSKLDDDAMSEPAQVDVRSLFSNLISSDMFSSSVSELGLTTVNSIGDASNRWGWRVNVSEVVGGGSGAGVGSGNGADCQGSSIESQILCITVADIRTYSIIVIPQPGNDNQFHLISAFLGILLAVFGLCTLYWIMAPNKYPSMKPRPSILAGLHSDQQEHLLGDDQKQPPPLNQEAKAKHHSKHHSKPKPAGDHQPNREQHAPDTEKQANGHNPEEKNSFQMVAPGDEQKHTIVVKPETFDEEVEEIEEDKPQPEVIDNDEQDQ